MYVCIYIFFFVFKLFDFLLKKKGLLINPIVIGIIVDFTQEQNGYDYMILLGFIETLCITILAIIINYIDVRGERLITDVFCVQEIENNLEVD